MKKMLLGSTEALEELMNEDVVDIEQPDTIQLGIPLFIRLLEYSRESVKDDAELHSITERLTEICIDGKVATMDDYDMIIDKQETQPEPDNSDLDE